MADLEALIKLRRHGVDEKRRFIAQLYRETEKLEQQKKVIEDRMEKEIELARQMATPEVQASLGKYLEGARKKVKALEKSVQKMNVRIAAAQEDMREAFADLKKIEITQRNRDQREEAEGKRREGLELDEIALEGFRRKEKDQ